MAPAHVAIDRRGNGPALVLLHGLGSTRAVWHRALPELGGRLLVTADLPGFGESPPAGPGFELDAVAERLAAPLADACDGPFDLVGHSLGGAVALTLAHERPDLVRRLVLSSPAGFAPRSALVARLAAALTKPAIGARRAIGSPLAASAAARRMLLANVVADGGALDPADARLILCSSRGARRLGAAVGAVAAADLRPRLRSLRKPVGVVWGERDRIFPAATAATLEAAAERVEVERIPGAGHVTQLERPDRFARALERLLDRGR